jgi:hypothetical protein
VSRERLLPLWGDPRSKGRCAPGEACMFDYGGVGYGFEDVESTSFLRWLTSPLTCNRPDSTGVERAACAARADVVVVRSACAMCVRNVASAAMCYQRGDAPNCTGTDCHDAVLSRFWERLRHHVDHTLGTARGGGGGGGGGGGRKAGQPPPLVLVHGFASWGDFYGTAVLRTLASQPAAFVARVVVATIEEPLTGRWPALDAAFEARMPGVRPTFVVVPYSIHTSRLARPSHEAGRRPFAAIFQGRPEGSFDGARAKFLEQMSAAGGVCDKAGGWRAHMGENVVCVLCEASLSRADCEARLRSSIARLGCRGEQLGTCAVGSMSLASQATLCIEPTSDDMMRSHFYLGVQAGCVPVIFDGSGDQSDTRGGPGMYGVVRQPTKWAWRQTELLDKLRRVRGDEGAEPFLRRANYSAFALPYFSADLTADRLGGLARELVALATKPAHAARLQALQAAVERAAPLMRWAPPSEPPCDGGEPCDAFSSLVAMVHAVRWAGSAARSTR